VQGRFFIQFKKDKSLKDLINQERYKGDETADRYEKLIYRALAQEQISTSKAVAMLGKSVEEIRDNFAVI
jgi:hypothetical protein